MDTEEVDASFDEFKQQWLADVEKDNPSTVELGRRFAHKIITQYFNLPEDDELENLYYCDGSSDGGIDIAYLEPAASSDSAVNTISVEDENINVPGSTWYLVQSKYGTAFQGTATLFTDGRKILDTLDGKRTRLCVVSQDVVNRLVELRARPGKQDRIVLLFATIDPLNNSTHVTDLNDLRAMGKERIGSLLEVKSISLYDLYARAVPSDNPASVTVPIEGRLVQDEDLLAGLVPLPTMYEFLHTFKQSVGELDRLYEKNVRSYLRSRKVNTQIKKTLREEPERFGLYNNGVTLVVHSFTGHNGAYELADPFVVNGCQTTNTIFDIFDEKANVGATGTPFQETDWYKKAEKGSVIVKIVKVSASSRDLLNSITTYTNSQNVVKEKDFLALHPLFQRWVKEMKNHGIFLEIQRPSWEIQLAKQARPTFRGTKYTKDEWANAFELLKVYGAGWLRVPGVAWNQNSAFLPPKGKIYDEITDVAKGEKDFGVDDLLAAYHLRKAGQQKGFGQNWKKADNIESRTSTRFLFYFVVIHLIREIIGHDKPRDQITQAMLELTKPENGAVYNNFLDVASQVIDEYMDRSSSDSVEKENNYKGNINKFLKSQQIGNDLSFTPILADHLRLAIKDLNRLRTGHSIRLIDEIRVAIKAD